MSFFTSESLRFIVEIGEKALLLSAILKGEYTILLLLLVIGLTTTKILADISDFPKKLTKVPLWQK